MSNNEEQKKPAAAKKQKPAGSGTSKRPARTAKPDQPVKKKKKKTEAVLHHSPEGHTGGKQETTDLWHLSVERIREASERERRKINSSNQQFLYFLLKLFLVLMILGSAVLFLTWKVLENYEKSTPNGAMSSYVHLLQEENYDKIYEKSTIIFTQFNEKEPYIEYLKSIYEGVDLEKAVFSKKAYSNDTFLYYDMMVDRQKIATLELIYNEDEKQWNVRTVTDARNFYIEVFGDAQVYVNGIRLNENYITERNVSSEAYSNLFDLNQAPLVTRYHIDNLVGIPTVTTQDDAQYSVVKDALQDCFYIADRPGGAMEEVMRTRIRDTAMTYAKYISEDTRFSDLQQYLYRRTNYYKAISSFVNRYFSTHDSYRFDNMHISDLISYGEDVGFTGTISFDYVVTIEGEKSQTYSNTYQMTFLNVSGKWLCSNLVIANQSQPVTEEIEAETE
ncbi:hypothetical protein [Holdemania massiliensis]|uniref:hypothetical protein n=1 Tax=Holdemania massiliensis TaxID=1468449 RepID=UPI0035635B9B